MLIGSSLVEQVMLTGQDGRRLVAIVVLSPSELVNAGFMTAAEGDRLQKANDALNNPQCTLEELEEQGALLQKASEDLRTKTDLQKALMTDIKAATAGFRAWEQVGATYVTLEPFAMVNGQLTQSYKVKRDAVQSRYGDELPK